MQKKLFIFDLDGTLARSKCPLGDDMAEVVCRLLNRAHVAVVSGASFSQFKIQFIEKLHCDELLTNLHILPTNGAAYFNYNKETKLWHEIYRKNIPLEDVKIIEESIGKAIELTGLIKPEKIYGKQIENRGTQITVSMLGQEAPISEKKAYDPDQKKRLMIRERLMKMIPNYAISIGGMTSIDITEKGVDKEFAIHELLRRLGLEKKDAIYVGDAIFPGGNDYPAVASGVETLKVKDPTDTKNKINSILAS